MNLLDDARTLAGFSAADKDGACVFDCGRGLNVHHARDCPWLSMPRIVAALDAVSREIPNVPYDCGFVQCQPEDDDVCARHRLEWALES